MQRLILVATPVLLLAACQTAAPAVEPELHAEWGSAVRHNIQAQAIVPTEAERNNRFIPSDRAVRTRALKNYREGTVPEPEPISTSGD